MASRSQSLSGAGSEVHEHDGPKAECAICRWNLDFQMPTEIVDACAAGRLIVFAGAGVSTENHAVLQDAFYERIADELGETDTSKTFSALMSQYANEKGRRLLLQRIKERLDYIDAFPELRRLATRFHRELSTLFYVDTIITTNWDPYFEQVTGALPLVTDKDFALSDMPGRKVLKVHGSILNVGSIVATEADYDRCYRALSKNVLGSTLKHLLATQTVVFVGYSFQDSDFSRIYRFLQRQMPDVLPRSYLVSPHEPPPGTTHGLSHIRTDGTFFIERLKAALVDHGCLMDDSRWDGIVPALFNVMERHDELFEKVTAQKQPVLIHCGCYQDGLIHAFERMLQQRGGGTYSHTHRVARLAEAYDDVYARAVRSKRYHDAAYARGYQNGLLYLLLDDPGRRALPLYYVHGGKSELRSFSAWKRDAAHANDLHRQAYRQAQRLASRLAPGVEFTHRPEL